MMSDILPPPSRKQRRNRIKREKYKQKQKLKRNEQISALKQKKPLLRREKTKKLNNLQPSHINPKQLQMAENMLRKMVVNNDLNTAIRALT